MEIDKLFDGGPKPPDPAEAEKTEREKENQKLLAVIAQNDENVSVRAAATVSYTHLTLPTKRIV